ncbi:MAG: hypothetical protein WKF70_12700, partial [Chitinophagaceae bacterium]
MIYAIEKNNGRSFTSKLNAFPAPDAYQAGYRPATGYEWSTYGLYEGENRRRGAPVSYYINPQKDTAKAGADSILVHIYNDRNEVVRNLKWKA